MNALEKLAGKKSGLKAAYKKLVQKHGLLDEVPESVIGEAMIPGYKPFKAKALGKLDDATLSRREKWLYAKGLISSPPAVHRSGSAVAQRGDLKRAVLAGENKVRLNRLVGANRRKRGELRWETKKSRAKATLSLRKHNKLRAEEVEMVRPDPFQARLKRGRAERSGPGLFMIMTRRGHPKKRKK